METDSYRYIILIYNPMASHLHLAISMYPCETLVDSQGIFLEENIDDFIINMISIGH